MSTKNRIRKKTERFGETCAIDTSDTSGTEDPYIDNSLDDKSYAPNESEKSSASSNLNDSQMNFDRQFDEIDRNSKQNCISTIEERVIAEQTADSSSPPEPIAGEFACRTNTNSFQSAVLEQLKLINRSNNEILTRLCVVEESLIKNGQMISLKREESEEVSDFEIFDRYVSMNKMPFKNVVEVNEFETGLDKRKMDEAVSIDSIGFPFDIDTN